MIYRLIGGAPGAAQAGETQDPPDSLPGDHRALEPPESIPNSEVKQCIADGSVGSPHVRVGHRQALITDPALHPSAGFFLPADNVGASSIWQPRLP